MIHRSRSFHIPTQLERHWVCCDDMSWRLSIKSFFMSLCFVSFCQTLGFFQLSDVTLTAWKGGPGRQSEWSMQSVWVALKSFETQGQGGSALELDTDKSTNDQKDTQKKTRILSTYDALCFCFLMIIYQVSFCKSNNRFDFLGVVSFPCEENGKPRICKLGQNAIINFGHGKMCPLCFTQ